MKKYYFLIIVALILGLVLTGCLLSNVGQVPTTEQSGISSTVKSNGSGSPVTINYGDVSLTSLGSTDSGHFPEFWDLTACDMIISFTYDANGLVDDAGAHAWAELGIRQFGDGDFNPTWMVEGAGVWLATDYDGAVDTFDPDPPGSPTLDLDDKLILQKAGGHGEGDYNLPSTPPNPGANHRVWWDRDGVDPWQNDETANTGGIYNVVIKLTAASATTGEAYMEINTLDQGFETDGDWSTIELTPAGMTFSGDMKHMQVFYGLYGYGVEHSISFNDITVEGCLTECKVDLIAGNPKNERTDAGDVIVRIDEENLYVTYETEEPWLMEEIHFHVDTPPNAPDSFPQKNGNPIPGKFTYKFEDLGELDTYSFPVSLPVPPCGQVYFAAHAKVYKLSDPINKFIVSEADSSMVYAYEEDTGNLGYPSSTFCESGSAVEALYPSWPSISGAKWISLGDWLEDVPDSDTDNHKEGWWGDYINSWWKFERTIDIPLNAVNISGTLTITSDNVEFITLGDQEVGYAEVYGFSNYLAQQWKSLNTHNIDLSPGSNDLNIMVRNFPRPVTSTYDNPTGLIYKLEYQYQLKTEETAWGEGENFSGKNWAMYFGCDYFLPECQ